MARGGRRARPSRTGSYVNRTDLNGAQLPADAPRGLPYGDRAKLIAAQRQVPMGSPGSAGGVASGAVPPPQPGGPTPGQVVPGGFTGPTARPGEPVTAGLPLGAGPGPEVLGANQGGGNDPLTQAVAALDALGGRADAETARLRDAMHATLGNRSAP